MTIEEATRILDQGSDSPFFPHEGDDFDEACRIAVAALRAQHTSAKLNRSRWEGCPICTAEYNPKDWGEGSAHDFRIKEDVLYYFDAQFGWEGIAIKFCPACGRPLTEEAWAEMERRIGGNNEATDN